MKNRAATFATISVTFISTLLQTTYAASVEATTTPSGGQSFTIPLNKGDYAFVGRNDGATGKDAYEVGCEPFVLLHVTPETRGKWTFHFTIDPKTNGSGYTCRYKWDRTVPDGTVLPYMEKTWDQSLPAGTGTSLITPHAIEIPKETQIKSDYKYWQIPYVDVNGETRFYAIAVASNPATLQTLIKLRTVDELWHWDQVAKPSP